MAEHVEQALGDVRDAVQYYDHTKYRDDRCARFDSGLVELPVGIEHGDDGASLGNGQDTQRQGEEQHHTKTANGEDMQLGVLVAGAVMAHDRIDRYQQRADDNRIDGQRDELGVLDQ